MMEDSNYENWVVVSSSEDSCDSDKIDSDVEAELYSVIHHEANTVTTPLEPQACQGPITDIAHSETSETLNKNPNVKKQPVSNKLCRSFGTSTKNGLHKNSFDEVQVIQESSNKSKKRKSDLLDNVLESIQLRTNSKQSECVNGVSSHKKQKTGSVSNINTVEIDSSNSDSIIWTEADERDLKIQINLEPEVVALTSDTFSDDSFSPFENSLSVCSENTSQPSTSHNNNSNDPWRINSEDLYRSKRGSGRYHQRAVLHCSNCNLKGHATKFCSVPKAVKCYICGGAHMAMRCKDKVCFKCFRAGHDSRFCNIRGIVVCIHCNMKGHAANHCPDLWRRYHLTTTQKNIIVGNPVNQNTPIYCFNCGQQGHYGAVCQAPRARYSFPTWTSVIAYTHPSETIKRTMETQRNSVRRDIPVWSSPLDYRRIPSPLPMSVIPFPQIQLPAKKKNKKKKKIPNNQLLTPGGKKKKKKNKANSASQTPESVSKPKTQTEVYFPRTPKPSRKKYKLQRKKNGDKNDEAFMTGLRRRLGLLPPDMSSRMQQNRFS